MTKPIVTEEMVERACDRYGFRAFDRRKIREILEAALGVQPRPQLTEEERRAVHFFKHDSLAPEASELLAIIDRLTGNTK